MRAIDFLQVSGTSQVKPVYAVFGDDAYLRRHSLKKIVHDNLGTDHDEMSVSRFPGESARLSEVFDELRTLPFLSKKRIVIVEDADAFVTAHRKELETYIDRPSSSGVLVLGLKSFPGNTRLAKLVEAKGLALECKSPADRELPKWLIALAKTRDAVVLDLDAADLMVELVGAEIGLLAVELDKLVTYVGTRQRIAREDVATMVDAGRIMEIWAAVDAVTTGRGDVALSILDRLLSAKESEHRIMGAISYSVLKTYHAGMLRQAKREARDACREAGVFPRDVDKVLKQHTHLGPKRVGLLPKLLLRADRDIKGASTLPPRMVLERLFVELAKPRLD